jgi:hypothetical protein
VEPAVRARGGIGLRAETSFPNSRWRAQVAPAAAVELSVGDFSLGFPYTVRYSDATLRNAFLDSVSL